MSECDRFQAEIDEVLALGGREDGFSPELEHHLAGCEPCREFSREGVLLNQMLDEPAPLPPPDLALAVMARIQAEPPAETRFPWAERLAWAASGAIAMFCLDHLPDFGSDWWAGLEQLTYQLEWSFRTPFALSASTLVLAALSLFVVQGVLVYKTGAVKS